MSTLARSERSASGASTSMVSSTGIAVSAVAPSRSRLRPESEAASARATFLRRARAGGAPASSGLCVRDAENDGRVAQGATRRTRARSRARDRQQSRGRNRGRPRDGTAPRRRRAPGAGPPPARTASPSAQTSMTRSASSSPPPRRSSRSTVCASRSSFPHLTNAVKIKLENRHARRIQGRRRPPGGHNHEDDAPRGAADAAQTRLRGDGVAAQGCRCGVDRATPPRGRVRGAAAPAVQAALVRSAGDAAARRFDDDAPQPATLAMTSASGKRILAVRPSPLHTLRELLFPSAMSALHGLAADMQAAARPLHPPRRRSDDRGVRRGGLRAAERDAVQRAEGCEEHVDRGLLTLVAGQTAATLEVYDRRQRKWVRPPATDESVVIFAGGTLHRASAGLVPAATGDADDGIGATLHRVAAGGDGAALARPPPPRAAERAASTAARSPGAPAPSRALSTAARASTSS